MQNFKLAMQKKKKKTRSHLCDKKQIFKSNLRQKDHVFSSF